MKLIAIFFLLTLSLIAYTDGSVLVLDIGATTLKINNSGPLGGSYTLKFPNTGSQDQGLDVTCPL